MTFAARFVANENGFAQKSGISTTYYHFIEKRDGKLMDLGVPKIQTDAIEWFRFSTAQ